MERPDTPTLLAIQVASAKTLAKAVERYLIECGELMDCVGSLMSEVNRRKISTNSKVIKD